MEQHKVSEIDMLGLFADRLDGIGSEVVGRYPGDIAMASEWEDLIYSASFILSHLDKKSIIRSFRAVIPSARKGYISMADLRNVAGNNERNVAELLNMFNGFLDRVHEMKPEYTPVKQEECVDNELEDGSFL